MEEINNLIKMLFKLGKKGQAPVRAPPTSYGFDFRQLIPPMVSGGILFAIIFGVLFGLTGISLFGFSGIFGIVAGATVGLVAGALMGLLFYFGTSDINPAASKVVRAAFFAAVFAFVGFLFPGGILGLLWGTIIGAVIGFILALLPQETANAWISGTLTIVILAVLIYLSFVWYKSGALAVLVGPLEIDMEQIRISITKGIKCINDPVDCLFKPFYDWSEPTIVDNAIEEVSVKVDFSETNALFFENEEIVIRSAIIVNNPLQDSYVLEPQCFLGNETMEVRETPRVESGVIYFSRSDIDQRVSVVCEKPGGLQLEEWDEEDMKSIDFELHLVKKIIARAEWNAYTLHQDVLKKKNNPFAGVSESHLKGRTVLSKMEYASPIKLSIGSDDDQPFFSGKWPFSVVLKKKGTSGELLSMKSIVIENPASRTVRITQPCQFGSSFNQFSLDQSQLSKVTQVLNKGAAPIGIHCTLSVEGLDMQKQVPEKTVIKASAEFDYEEVYKRQVTIMSGIRREELFIE